MKKNGFSLIKMLAVISIVCGLSALAVIAGQVYGRDLVTVGTTTGTVTFTNTYQYAALDVKKIWLQYSSDAASTVTIKRVAASGVWTNTIGTVVLASGAGTLITTNCNYLKYGDKITFANSTATGATAMIEYEVQQH